MLGSIYNRDAICCVSNKNFMSIEQRELLCKGLTFLQHSKKGKFRKSQQANILLTRALNLLYQSLPVLLATLLPCLGFRILWTGSLSVSIQQFSKEVLSSQCEQFAIQGAVGEIIKIICKFSGQQGAHSCILEKKGEREGFFFWRRL